MTEYSDVHSDASMSDINRTASCLGINVDALVKKGTEMLLSENDSSSQTSEAEVINRSSFQAESTIGFVTGHSTSEELVSLPTSAESCNNTTEAKTAVDTTDITDRIVSLTETNELTEATEVTDARELTNKAGELNDTRRLTETGPLTEERELRELMGSRTSEEMEMLTGQPRELDTGSLSGNFRLSLAEANRRIDTSRITRQECDVAFRNSDIYECLVTDESAELLGKSKEELEKVVEKIYFGLGVNKLSVLLALPDTIRIRNGIPVKLNKWLDSQAERLMELYNSTEECHGHVTEGVHHRESSGYSQGGYSRSGSHLFGSGPEYSLESLIAICGITKGLQVSSVQEITDCVVRRHLINSVLLLKDLDDEDIEVMIQHLKKVSKSSNQQLNTIEEFMRNDLRELQLTPSSVKLSDYVKMVNHQLDSRVLEEEYQLTHLEHIYRLTVQDLKSIVLHENLPVGLHLSLKKFCRDYSQRRVDVSDLAHRNETGTNDITSKGSTLLSQDDDKYLDLNLSSADYGAGENVIPQGLRSGSAIYYIEPSVEEFLNRVGVKYCHPTSQVATAKKVLLDENWIGNLDQLRVLSDVWFDQLSISPALIRNIIGSLHDPEILGMDIISHAPVNPLIKDRVNGIIKSLTMSLDKASVPDVGRFSFGFGNTVSSPADRSSVKTSVLRALVRLFQHLLLTPEDPTKRVLRKDNPIFDKVVKHDGAKELITTLGYTEYETLYLLPILNVELTSYIHQLLVQVINTNDTTISSQTSDSTDKPRTDNVVDNDAPLELVENSTGLSNWWKKIGKS